MNIIKKIWWNRVNLCFETAEDIVGEVFLVDDKGGKSPISAEGNTFSLNITNISHGDMIESGAFGILVNGERPAVDKSLINELDGFTRVFKYRADFYALVITFSADEKGLLTLSADYMMKNRKYKKNYLLREGNGIRGKIIVTAKILLPFFMNVFCIALRLFKFSKKKTVLFFSENGNEPIGNLKFLYEFMQKNTSVTVKGNFLNMHGKKTFVQVAKAVKDIALSDVIVLDNYASLINVLRLSPKQKVVQLWHAGVGFKAVGYARFGKDGGAHPFKSSHRKYDIAFVDDEKLIDIYKEVFGASEDIFKAYGMPRLHNYFTRERIAEVTERLFNENALLRGKKIILFSPTYRGVTADDAFYDYSNIDLNKIYSFCKKNGFCFVVKMHPFIKEKIQIPQEYSDLIFDCSHTDINDLIYISDIMITDYSSCAYEFSFFERPLVFYRFDKEFYEYTRPVHTLDVFSSVQFEVTEFEALMNVLEDLKDKVSVQSRFDNLKIRKANTCGLIAEEILR